MFTSIEEKFNRLSENLERLENDGDAMTRNKFNAVQAGNNDLIKSIEDELSR